MIININIINKPEIRYLYRCLRLWFPFSGHVIFFLTTHYLSILLTAQFYCLRKNSTPQFNISLLMLYWPTLILYY